MEQVDFSGSKAGVSVIMPTFNVEDYVEKAITSILSQTFRNFEFIIIDDGSTDDTPEIIRSFHDPRIQFFARPHLASVYQLNYGLKKASRKYIARQDGDDRSRPDRLGKQVTFLDTHPEYAVVSSFMELIDDTHGLIGVLEYPREPDSGKLMEKCCISHAASMWRREIHDCVGDYDEEFNRNCCEDYDLWLRVSEHFRFYVLDDVLYTKTEHPKSSISQTRHTYVPIYDELARKKARMRQRCRITD